MELLTEGSKIALCIIQGLDYKLQFWNLCEFVGDEGFYMHNVCNAISYIYNDSQIDKSYFSTMRRIARNCNLSISHLEFLSKEAAKYKGDELDFMNYFETIDIIY